MYPFSSGFKSFVAFYPERIHHLYSHTQLLIIAPFRISYADAFAVAQAILSSAELITTDHKEFEPLEKAGIVKIK